LKFTYDPDFNIAYIRLRGKIAKATTAQVSDEINFDLGPDGRIYRIEFPNANE